MKTTKKFLILLIVIVTTACSSIRNTSMYGDDIYYSPGDNQNNNNNNQQTLETYTDGNVNMYITNNYYGDNNTFYQDDYYYYPHSARIKRFYSGLTFGYYHPWYTNIYWYNYDPLFFGTSIYITYPWWYPNPWVRYDWGWYSGWCPGWGCVHGYWDVNNYYYNNFGGNSWYYRPRGWYSSGWGGGTNTKGGDNMGQIYQKGTQDYSQMRQVNRVSGNDGARAVDNIVTRGGDTDIRTGFVTKEGRTNKPVGNLTRPNTDDLLPNNHRQKNYYKQLDNKPRYNYNDNIGFGGKNKEGGSGERSYNPPSGSGRIVGGGFSLPSGGGGVRGGGVRPR